MKDTLSPKKFVCFMFSSLINETVSCFDSNVTQHFKDMGHLCIRVHNRKIISVVRLLDFS